MFDNKNKNIFYERFIDDCLRNYALAEIWSFERLAKSSTDFVYGKDVVIHNKAKEETYRIELESWYSTITFLENTSWQEIARKLKEECRNKEFSCLPCESSKCTIHQLCDWQWLESEDGKIIRERKTFENGKPIKIYEATIVKYAKCLEDLD